MHLYKNLLLGNDGNGPFVNKTDLFYPPDTKELYEKNLISKPDDWIYRTKSVNYKFNEYGHRCEPAHTIVSSDYILFAGCSHTVGVGLALEDTYPYLVSEKLGMPYYNLAVGGAGSDLVLYNVNTFLANFTPPKILVIQPPNFDRSMIKTVNGKFTSFGPWILDRSIAPRTPDEFVNLYKTMFSLQYANIADTYRMMFESNIACITKMASPQTKVIIITVDEMCLRLKDDQPDIARDDKHLGIFNNRNAAQRVLQKVSGI